MMSEDTIIAIPVCRITPCFTEWRIKRINEALGFKGTIGNRKKHIIATLPGGGKACLLKPGREAKRKQNRNLNDMFPFVGNMKVGEKYSFEYIWGYLVKISLIDQMLFRKVLMLLYRLCYFLDHQKNKEGKLRYKPSKEMQKCIDKMNKSIMEKFKKKFKTDCPELMEFLHMIDMIGWNEDVKYHGRDGKLDSRKQSKRTGMPKRDGEPGSRKQLKRIGMPNTVLSVISVPLEINILLKNAANANEFNAELIISAMYKFSKSQGIYVLSDKKLRKYLSSLLKEVA